MLTSAAMPFFRIIAFNHFIAHTTVVGRLAIEYKCLIERSGLCSLMMARLLSTSFVLFVDACAGGPLGRRRSRR